MTPEDRERLFAGLCTLAECCRAVISDVDLERYWTALADLPWPAVVRALCLAAYRGQLPAPPDLRILACATETLAPVGPRGLVLEALDGAERRYLWPISPRWALEVQAVVAGGREEAQVARLLPIERPEPEEA